MRISDWSSDVCSSDLIKIDRSFVSSINQNSESAAIVSAIARLGDSLGLPITAEGIEDKDIERRLRRLGCTKGQGWYFGKPLSRSEEHTSELQSLMRISYADFCLKKKQNKTPIRNI